MKYKKGDKVDFRFAGGSFTGVVLESQTGYTGQTKYTIEGLNYPGKYFAYEKDITLATSKNTVEDLTIENECKKEKKTRK
jgi:hypothetical protein